MQTCVLVHDFIEMKNWITAFGEELDCSAVNVFLFWALRFCSMLPLQADDSWNVKLPACSDCEKLEWIKTEQGSWARAEILCRSSYFKWHFAHIREIETQSFIKERLRKTNKPNNKTQTKQKTPEKPNKTKPYSPNFRACGN